MSDRSKETADAISEGLRKEAARADEEQYYTLDDAAESMREFAERLDKALKRERAAFDCECAGIAELAAKEEAARHKPGNAAALREALNKVGNAAAWIAESCNDQQTAKYMNDIIAIVQSALSAPARNCDCFASYADAENYWHENVECADVNGCFDVWLFELAQLKGEGDGR